MYFPSKAGRERASAVYVNAVYIYNSSQASEQTATKHVPRTFIAIDRLCRVAFK